MFDVRIFKERLRVARERKFSRQEDFAKAIGIARASASYYENTNNSSLPNVEVLYNMAKELNVSYNYLMGGDDCFSQEDQFIMDYTGLSPKAIEALKKSKEGLHKMGSHHRSDFFDETEFRVINFIIENFDKTYFMSNLYSYLFMRMYFIDQSEIKRHGPPIDPNDPKVRESAFILGFAEEYDFSLTNINSHELNDMFLAKLINDLIKLKEIAQQGYTKYEKVQDEEGAVNGEHHAEDE